MKIYIADPHYPAFLNKVYSDQPDLSFKSYSSQQAAIMDKCFGTADFYSSHLNDLGYEARDYIVNCPSLQLSWIKEFGHYNSRYNIFNSFFKNIPYLNKFLVRPPNETEIMLSQIEDLKPDIFFSHDIGYFPPNILSEVKQRCRMVVGQIACPLPHESFIEPYDLLLTSFPHYVEKFHKLGKNSEYFALGFDEKVLAKLSPVKKQIPVSFVGGISPAHSRALPLFEYLARNTPIQFYGYGSESIDQNSIIKQRHRGEAWAIDMYNIIASSNITINRHIDVAEKYANNCRLFEATGVGTLLITDLKCNLHELFDIEKEVVVYSSPEEAVEKILYYLRNPIEANKIATAGQRRTLKDHSYKVRMKQLSKILERYIN